MYSAHVNWKSTKICTFYLLRNLPILRTVCHRSCCEFLKLAFCLEICFRVRDERMKSCILSILYFRVEWISTFWRFSKLVTLLPMRYIFRSLIQNNQQVWKRGKVFIFKNSQGCFLKVCKYIPLTSKNDHQKKIWN